MADKEKKLKEAESKPAKPKKEKKKGRLKNAWKGFVSETKKVVWPNWKQVLKNTGIVIVIVAVCTVGLFLMKIAFTEGIGAFLNLFL